MKYFAILDKNNISEEPDHIRIYLTAVRKQKVYSFAILDSLKKGLGQTAFQFESKGRDIQFITFIHLCRVLNVRLVIKNRESPEQILFDSETMEDTTVLGQYVYQWRDKSNWPRKDFAEFVNVGTAALFDFEKNKRNVMFTTLLKILTKIECVLLLETKN